MIAANIMGNKESVTKERLLNFVQKVYDNNGDNPEKKCQDNFSNGGLGPNKNESITGVKNNEMGRI